MYNRMCLLLLCALAADPSRPSNTSTSETSLAVVLPSVSAVVFVCIVAMGTTALVLYACCKWRKANSAVLGETFHSCQCCGAPTVGVVK